MECKVCKGVECKICQGVECKGPLNGPMDRILCPILVMTKAYILPLNNSVDGR